MIVRVERVRVDPAAAAASGAGRCRTRAARRHHAARTLTPRSAQLTRPPKVILVHLETQCHVTAQNLPDSWARNRSMQTGADSPVPEL